MLKRNKGYIILTTLVTALPMVMGFLLWDQLPDRMATHFDINGVADGWSGKAFAVIGLPMFMVAIHLICVLATMMDPRRKNVQDKVFRLVLWICPVISFFTMGLTLAYNLGLQVNISRLVMILIGLVFLIMGNYMPKCRQNYTIGVKTPWTLSDPENWNRTHRLAGWLWTGSGIVLALMGLLNVTNFPVLMGVILVVALIPGGYSYWYYVKHGSAE